MKWYYACLKYISFFQKGGKLKGPYEKIFEDKKEVNMTNGNEHSDIIFEELQPGASYKIAFSISLFEGMKTVKRLDFSTQDFSNMIFSNPWFKNSWLKRPGLRSSWLKSVGLKGPGLKLVVEKSGVEMSITDKRTDVWSRPSCIYTQIFSPIKTGFSPIKNTLQFFFDFFYLYSMQLLSADHTIFSKNFKSIFYP